MILREEKFSAVRINWRPKAENLISLAEELNLGVDQMVFVDDSPEERELMRQILPQVLTVDLPHDPSLYREKLEVLPQIQTLLLTEEDRSRVEQYQSQRQRQLRRDAAPSLEAHLHSLNVQVKIERAGAATLARVHQLLQRTNQFNLTTRRYAAEELAGFVRDPAWRIYTLRARDCFGDHGVVAAALVRTEAKRWIIDSLIMSCRVIGYGVETAFLAAVVAGARAQGISAVVGEYIATKKNAPARDFYSKHGFVAEDAGGEGEIARWRLDLTRGSVEGPAWIQMEVNDDS
jgi:FkbH-like protein